MSPFLDGSSGDPQELRRRIAFQDARGVPPAESAYHDFRSNGGPISIGANRIARQLINASGIPQRDLTGKRTLGGSPFALGDVDPNNLLLLKALLNLFGYYTYATDTPVAGVERWLIDPLADTEAPPYLAMLNDNDILPRYRIIDLLCNEITITAQPGGNFLATIGWVASEHDFHGAVVQTEGGTSGLVISSITRVGTTATATTAVPHGLATGAVVAVTGATEGDYNVNAVITVTGASTFTYTVANDPSTPATGSPVYATNGLSITGITRSGTTATATTAVAHGLVAGDVARVSGADQAGYNGDVTLLDAPTTTTFTYAVDSGTVTPATGTVVYEGLNATLPVLSGTWEGNWDDDDTDRDIYLEVQSVSATGLLTLRPKVSAAAAYSATFTAQPGLDTAGNPIRTRVPDESGDRIGVWSEQVRVHFPAGGSYPPGSTYRIPKRRTARWTQTLGVDRPIGSVGLELRLDDEPIRFEEGVSITLANTTEVVPDTPGRQGATTLRRGPITATLVPSRRISDLRLQEALHQGSTLSAVLDARTDVEIGATGREYRVVVMLPSCTLSGDMHGTAAGGQNRTEAPQFMAGEPDSTFTYDSLSTDAHVAVVVENDLTEADLGLA